MSISIREAGPDDVDAILGIDKQFSPVFAQPASYRRLIDRTGTVILASLGDDICGFAACSRVLDEATLLNFVVVTSARSMGVGRKLLAALIQRLGQLEVSRLLLEVRESNVLAQHLYLSAGFQRDGRRPGYYSSQNGAAAEAAILMSRQMEIDNASA